MSKLTPPSTQHPERRLKFFLEHQDYPKAEWHIFNIKNLMIKRDYDRGLFGQGEFMKRLKELTLTQGLYEMTLEQKITLHGG